VPWSPPAPRASRPLAQHAHFALREFEAIDVEAGELGEAKTRRVRELDERAIAQREVVVAVDRDEPRRFVGRQRRRQAFGRFRRLEAGAGVVAHRRIGFEEVAEERPPRGQHPREAATGKPAAVQRREEP
jgi:hypothetical protein